MSRLSSLIENARDLTLEAAKDAGPRRTTKPLPAQQIKKLLDSSAERDVLDGLKRVIAMQYANPPQPTLTFFPAVLKTLSKQTASTRPLVYNYLLHHAEADPDTALLAINTIQKTLSDSSPRVRALALKTIAGIRVPIISQIISLAIKKGVSDLSPVVRKTAALACIKCVRLDPNTRPQIEDYIKTLLGDQQYYVVGAAVQAFLQVCPDRLDLIHPVYRKLCKMVLDMDEWGQLATLRLMLNYARLCFPLQKRTVPKEGAVEMTKDFYEEIDPQSAAQETREVRELDPDLVLILKAAGHLLQSRSSSVIIAVTRLYRYLAPEEYLSQSAGPLVGLLRSPKDIRELALHNIVQVCLCQPTAFVKHYRHFFINVTDSSKIRSLKLEVLTLSFPHLSKDIQSLILAEVESFSTSHDKDLVRESVRAIGRCAQTPDPVTSRRCLALLLKQIHAEDSHLVGEAVEVVRQLIQADPDRHRHTVIQLAKHLDSLSSPTARSNVIWLVGEFSGHDIEQNIAPDVLRILVKDFANEADEVKQQIVLLAAKVYLHELTSRSDHPKAEDDGSHSARDEATSTVTKLYQYVLVLARYSQSYDIRDRARTYKALLGNSESTELARLMLLAPKPVPQAPSPSEAGRTYALGSASLVVSGKAGHSVSGYEAVPDWVEAGAEPDPKLRDVHDAQDEKSVRTVSSAGQRLDQALSEDTKYRSEKPDKKEKSLDAWLDEEEEEDEEDESDEEETEEESSEYESDTESEEASDDDDDDENEATRLVA